MEDFSENDMFEGQPLDIGETPKGSNFVPNDQRQRQKNKNDKKTTAKKADTSIIEPVAALSNTPAASTSPREETQMTDNPIASIDALLEGVPELFEASAKVGNAIQGILPVKPSMAALLVVAAAGLACYLSQRGQN